MNTDYDTDIVLWSERQALALRQLQATTGSNTLDWENVIEEIESVGRSETRAVEAAVFLALEHLIKVQAWPGHPNRNHWLHKARTALRSAR